MIPLQESATRGAMVAVPPGSRCQVSAKPRGAVRAPVRLHAGPALRGAPLALPGRGGRGGRRAPGALGLRGQRAIAPVGPGERLMAGDRLSFAGVLTTIVDLQRRRGLAPAGAGATAKCICGEEVSRRRYVAPQAAPPPIHLQRCDCWARDGRPLNSQANQRYISVTS